MDIKKVLKERGYTLVKVATEMGVTKSALSQMVNGNPSVSTLRRIAEIVGCQIIDFFEDETEPTLKCPNCGKSFKVNLTEIK